MPSQKPYGPSKAFALGESIEVNYATIEFALVRGLRRNGKIVYIYLSVCAR